MKFEEHDTYKKRMVPFEQVCGLNCIKDKGENIDESWIASSKKKHSFNSADLRCLFVCLRGRREFTISRQANRVSRLDLH